MLATNLLLNISKINFEPNLCLVFGQIPVTHCDVGDPFKAKGPKGAIKSKIQT